MELSITFSHIAKIDLFNLSIFYDNYKDAEYILTNNKLDVDLDFILEYVKGTKMLTLVLNHIPSLIDSYTYKKIARKFPAVIPVLITRLKIENKLDSKKIQIFFELLINSNSKKLLEPLLEFKDFLNDYQHTLVLCGTGSVDDMIERINIINEMPDECIETAYLCKNLPVLKYLRDTLQMTNIFLDKIIRQEEFVNDWNRMA